MDIAIIALTDQGAEQGKSLQKSLDHTTLFVSNNTTTPENSNLNTFASLRSFAEDQFDRYDAFVCVMAAGIAVRVFAPLLESKDRDPAVLVMDENGSWIIPLLSGHLGGANQLARRISRLTEADPVITTATDVNDVPAIDERNRVSNMSIHPLRHIKDVNLALLDGERVHVLSDVPLDWSLAHFRIERLSSSGPIQLDQISLSSSCGVIVSNRTTTGEPEPPLLFLRPRNLYAGLGYRKNKQPDELITAIESALERCYKHQSSLVSLSTIDLKKGNRAIEKTADHFDVPVRFFSGAELRSFEDECNTSEFVRETTGAGNVCEAAALASTTNRAEVIQEKTVTNGITTALVEETFVSSDSDPGTSS